MSSTAAVRTEARTGPPARPGPVPPVYLRTGRGGAPIRLFEGDALVGFPRELSDGSVDAVVTSPPYNIGVRYSRYVDRRPREEYLDWIGQVGRTVARALAPEGSFFLNVAGTPKDPTLPWEIAGRLRATLTLQNVLHWVKSIAIERALVGRDHGLVRDLTAGHYKPLRSDRYLHGAHEYLFHFTHTGSVRIDRLAVGVRYEDGSNARRWSSSASGVRCRGNVWFVPYRTIRRRASDRPHPATFPAELAERCFRLHGLRRIRLAADPFVGIGSSAVAAARLGLPFVGFDLDPGYLAEADRRLALEESGG